MITTGGARGPVDGGFHTQNAESRTRGKRVLATQLRHSAGPAKGWCGRAPINESGPPRPKGLGQRCNRRASMQVSQAGRAPPGGGAGNGAIFGYIFGLFFARFFSKKYVSKNIYKPVSKKITNPVSKKIKPDFHG